MRKINFIIFCVFIAFSFLDGAIDGLFDGIKQDPLLSAQAQDKNLLDKNETSSEVVLSIQKMPSKVYKNQSFSIGIEAIISNKEFDKIETTFVDHYNVEIINPTSEWTAKGGNRFINHFSLRILDNNFSLPKIGVAIYRGERLLHSRQVMIPNIDFFDIGGKPLNFSNVIADELKIVSVKSKYFDNKSIITILELRSQNGNLQDFRLKNVTEQGIEGIKEDEDISEITYFVTTPTYQKTLEFEYLNSKDNTYKKFIIPIDVVDDIVSTQTDLNPKDSSFYFYKIYFYIALIVGLLVFFIVKKSKKVLFISLLPLYLLYDLTLNNDSCILKKNTNIYILPTKNSTIFKVVEEDIKVEIINEKENFLKVVFPNRQIGWAKKDDIGKN